MEHIAKKIVADQNERAIRCALWQNKAARPKYLRGYVWASVVNGPVRPPLLSSE
jgi:hypothetical protein